VCQLCGVGNLGETIALLGKLNTLLAGLTRHILMSIQDDLCSKGRMAAHLDGDMPPIRVKNVERIVIDKRILPSQVNHCATFGPLHIPNWGRRTSDQDQKYPGVAGFRRKISLSDFVFPLSWLTVDHRNLMGFGIPTNTTTQPPRHSHQMGIVQLIIRTHQSPPPGTKTACSLSHLKVGVQDNPIHAIIGGFQQALIILAKLIHYFLCPLALSGDTS